MDPLDRKIVAALECDGRLTHAELGRRFGVSGPAIAERIARLMDTRVIVGFRAILNPAAFGLNQEAIIEFTPFGPDYERSVERVLKRPEIRLAYRVTGEGFLFLIVRTQSNEHLNELLLAMTKHGKTRTSIVLRPEVGHRPLCEPVED